VNVAESTDGVVVSVASLTDLWYVTQTTKAVTEADLAELRKNMSASPELSLHPIDEHVATTEIHLTCSGTRGDRFMGNEP
jgi:hypothetical protein